MEYIDLFAGLGGFHLALDRLGHKCVFASEINEDLRALYKKNFGMDCAGDIRNIRPEDIPAHDILCAGFPCQPFSKAGSRKGLSHPESGDLYFEILKVIKYHKPKYIILENVPNLKSQGNGKIWKMIKEKLKHEGYNVDIQHLSPHQYGIPQVRYRIYIIGSLTPLDNIAKKVKLGPKPKKITLESVLSVNTTDPIRPISKEVKERIMIWQEFLDLIPRKEHIISPLWGMEFGATYPFENTTPFAMSKEELSKYKGAFGHSLNLAKSKKEMMNMLPSYARTRQRKFPEWKVIFIRKNRGFLKKNDNLLSSWIKKIEILLPSQQKFEWNCHKKNPLDEIRVLERYVIQMRPSGIRVKRPDVAPSLVAMNMTQVPIILWENRYVGPSECKLLQSMGDLKYLPETTSLAYSALGNAVNVTVARRVALALIGKAKKTKSSELRFKDMNKGVTFREQNIKGEVVFNE